MRALAALAALLASGACAAEQQRARRRNADDLLLSSHMPPAERALTRGDALQLLRRVNVLGDNGAWSLDIGGSLAKVAFFRRRDPSLPSCASLLGGCASLAAESLYVPALGGDVHFVLFETRDIDDCLEFVDRFWVRGLRDRRRGRGRTRERASGAACAEGGADEAHDAAMAAVGSLAGGGSGGGGGMPRRTVTMRATGGGSVKYRAAFERIGVSLQPRDEMRSMVHGLNFLLTSVRGEAFSVDAGDPLSPLSPERAAALTRTYLPPQQSPFPYLFVSIGTGVSIIEVTGWGDKFRRVDGSSIGGGTFWGLCRLLLQCGSFDELIALTERGVSSNVDMLVGDIYGGDCASHSLNRDVIAASFGKVLMRPRGTRASRTGAAVRRAAGQLASGAEGAALSAALLLGRLPLLSALARRAGLKRIARRRRARLANARLSRDFRAEDIALSLLRLVSNNVGQLACLNAQKHGLSRIFFGGSFIRNHPYTVATLANAVKFFSKGTVEAHFLKREGFVGALGALLDAEEPLVRAHAVPGGASGGAGSSAGGGGAERSVTPGSSAEDAASGVPDELAQPSALGDLGMSELDPSGPSPLPARLR